MIYFVFCYFSFISFIDISVTRFTVIISREWYDGDGWVSSGYYHGVCYSNYLVEAEAYYYEHATVYCPICGYETGEYGQQYLGNHGGSTDCPQCGNEMKEHETFLK